MSTINVESNNKMITYENKKNCFDNENNNDNNDNNDNDIMASPFFNRIVSQKKDTQTQSTYDEKNKISFKEKNDLNKNIMGFIQINNEINPFNIKDNNINFFDKDIKNKLSKNKILILPQNQQCNDEILSFRKRDEPEKNNKEKNNNIIIINNFTSEDKKINIEIKYTNNNLFKNFIHENFNNLKINKFYLEFNKRKKIKKISARFKETGLIKEKEYINQLDDNNLFMNNLSIIKEEESPIMHTFKKMKNYYPISNNSKLYSKSSVEKIIDGDKEINEDDIDKILMGSLSENKDKYYNCNKLKNWQSQEIMVVSNFNSIMRSRINRKENAKLLIEGILYLIKFFSILCFNIRRNTFIKLKWNWKLNKLRNYVILFCIKSNIKQSRIDKNSN